MNDINKNIIDDIEIYDYNGPGYKSVMSHNNWRIAYLTHSDRYNKDNFHEMERHLETDEVFILLQGAATLVIGKEQNMIIMEPYKVYNVKKGIWHHIFTDNDTKVLIIENEDTCSANSEYTSISV